MLMFLLLLLLGRLLRRRQRRRRGGAADDAAGWAMRRVHKNVRDNRGRATHRYPPTLRKSLPLYVWSGDPERDPARPPPPKTFFCQRDGRPTKLTLCLAMPV